MRFREMVESALATARGPIEVVAVLDGDDDTRHDYPADLSVRYVMSSPGQKQSDMWNTAWAHATGDVAHMCADDLIFMTHGWDVEVERAFLRWRDRIGLIYANDLDARISTKPFFGQNQSHAQNGRYCFSCNPFVSREWIAALDGRFTAPYFHSWEADTWLYQVAVGISRAVYLHDVIIEHRHPMNGKAEVDATYDRGVWDKPGLQAAGWRRTKMGRKEREGQIAALTKAIQDARVKA